MTVIKGSIKFIKKPLTNLINSSLISGHFSSKLKISKVISIFKKDDTKEVSCYKPVTILPSFSKIFKHIVYNELLKFLESNKLLDKEQHGFLPGKSTITLSIEFIENIINSVDQL
ncbi:hypothetical protein J6590_108838 [Homalodisca vitripennis]|nr:hypothetical protein J6590_108838 [Homalodisca vitripennis]